MHVVALCSQKGGSGKTTLAGHLGVQAELAGAGPVALIDTDPQGSVAAWWNARQSDRPASRAGDDGSPANLLVRNGQAQPSGLAAPAGSPGELRPAAETLAGPAATCVPMAEILVPARRPPRARWSGVPEP
jgi:hypothetical protein